MSTAQELKTNKSAWNKGFYWGMSEEGPWYGPHASHEEALEEMWQDGFGEERFEEMKLEKVDDSNYTKEKFLTSWEWVGCFEHGPISTEIFDADYVLESLEEKNEDQVWWEAPPNWPQEAKRELEQMLGDALFRWIEKHNLWGQFLCLNSATQEQSHD
ncbi:hypothetical protein [Shimia sp.]|uniref:hypothetical protein n=1 Tax=Shimia sp. TaxID=1954381 RepID=UPI003BAD3DF9